MTDQPRSRILSRVRAALWAANDRALATSRPALAPARASIRSGRLATRGSWLLLADGRPALRIARDRR